MAEQTEAFAEIEKHRAQIDAIDKQLVALLTSARPFFGHSCLKA